MASGWRPTTRVGIYQTSPVVAENLRRAIIAWGRGFGDESRGMVCMHAGHNLLKIGTNANSISALRAYFNFSLLAAINRTIYPVLTGVPDNIIAGTGSTFSYTLTPAGGTFNTQWSSSCGGTFSPSATSANVTYTPPAGATSCIITVQISDACGRVFFDSKIVSVQCELNVSRTVTNVSCNGGNNGSINMSISGSPGPYSWNWTRMSPAGSGSGSGNSITNLTGGSYNVTVTSPAGCQATFTSLVTQPNALVVTPVVTNYNCFGQTGSVSLGVTGGTPGYSYNWSGPGGYTASSQNISGRPAGTYSVTVTDANGCTSSTTATILGPASALTVVLTSKTDVSCLGENTGSINITASGGTPGYSYNWSDGATSEDRSGLGAGQYSVTVTDANGCTSSLVGIPINVIQNTDLGVLVNNISCAGGTNGSIEVTASGVSPFNLSWSGPVSGNPAGNEINVSGGSYTISNLSAGSYNISVTDGNNCTSVFSRTLTAPAVLVATPSVTNFLCFGQTGSVSLTVLGGTPGYNYNWSGPGGFTASTQNISNRPSGMYNVTVTDTRGCTALASGTITGPTSELVVGLGSKTNVSCNGNMNGAINIVVTGGTPGYGYVWSDGSTAQNRSGLSSGSYTVTVTDANGCTATRTEVISQPAPLVVTLTKTDPTCPPGANAPFNADGTITTVVAGGTSPYTYLWGDGPTSQNRSGLQAGTYSVTVTDANGCTAIQGVTLTNTLPLPSPPGVINNN